MYVEDPPSPDEGPPVPTGGLRMTLGLRPLPRAVGQLGASLGRVPRQAKCRSRQYLRAWSYSSPPPWPGRGGAAVAEVLLCLALRVLGAAAASAVETLDLGLL